LPNGTGIAAAMDGGGSGLPNGTGIAAAIDGGGSGLPNGTGIAAAMDGGGSGLPNGTGMAAATDGGGSDLSNGAGIAALATVADKASNTGATSLIVKRGRVFISASFRAGMTPRLKRTAGVEYPKRGIVATTKVPLRDFSCGRNRFTRSLVIKMLVTRPIFSLCSP
jgi:hypothetical protein